MKTLRSSRDREEVIARLRRLRPDSASRWGRMTAPQMVRHLTDAFQNILGERAASSSPRRRAPFVGRTLVKWMALYAPVPWPKGMRTHPLADQERGGTPPSGDFAADVLALEQACARFIAAGQRGRRPSHFMFGSLSESQWCRWAYLHMDHHLRQFGL